MSEQRLHVDVTDGLPQRTSGDDATGSTERLAATRAELEPFFTAADAILDRIRMSNSTRLLEQMRQSGGQ